MTFPTGMVEMRKYSDEELKAMLEESREVSKHSRKLGRVMGTAADHPLQQLKHVQAREQLATWRRAHNVMIVGCMAPVPYRPKNSPKIYGLK